ncbi:MAG: response regulator [Proteobacteria bacterium]|nr:response regulator [Pseudomonadota bacterium]MBI3499507.1 response regulator [Pseudomonadota bacterium]
MASVLVIDDDAAARRLFAQVLSREGHVIRTSADGQLGLEQFKQARPDVVVTDLIMPNREGIETIRAMRAFDPSVPIIAMSGNTGAKLMNFLKLAKVSGATLTLEKPFRPSELVAAVSKVLGRQ